MVYDSMKQAGRDAESARVAKNLALSDCVDRDGHADVEMQPRERVAVNSLENATSSSKYWLRNGMVGLAAAALLYAGYGRSISQPSRVVETRRPVFSGPGSAPPARLVHLEAGARFDDRRPPEGWSRLVLKSTPRLTSGDLDTLSEEAFKTAGRVRLAIVADVVPTDSGRYALDRVGVGLSAPADDDKGDVIVTPRVVDGSKGPWSTKQRIILTAGSFELSHAALVAATPTFALVRMPTKYLLAGEHKKASLLYAFLVDAASGRLRTFVWRDAADQAPRVLNELETPATVDGVLDVKAGKLAGIPITWSFAMTTTPGETEHAVAPELAERLAPGRIEATAPDELESTITAVSAAPVKARREQPASSETPAP
ncbi:hypothetical protein BSF38_05542 [Paludisphaera borealis]|uniref:Uncharacterized protein n=1 Tax=Paludisphaera borealis TaxID=1387353 RepID=A0A1U7CYD3_9BACT|nr:hypothetical protein BSF38_05542 [Paludisphaera borealis]